MIGLKTVSVSSRLTIGKIAIYIMLGIQTFDTCLEMTQGMAHSWREES